MREPSISLVPIRRIENSILVVRSQKVILDKDLAILYGVSTSRLNEAVKRNRARFPSDFMFQLTSKEYSLISQFAISKQGRGGRRNTPYVFTEQGIAMLSSVLNSERAVQVNVAIMRTFVRLREMFTSNKELVRKLNELEQKYDKRFRVIFEAIRQLTTPPASASRPIGFGKNKK